MNKLFPLIILVATIGIMVCSIVFIVGLSYYTTQEYNTGRCYEGSLCRAVYSIIGYKDK